MYIKVRGKFFPSEFESFEERFATACKKLGIFGGMSFCKANETNDTEFTFNSNSDDVKVSFELGKNFAWLLHPIDVEVSISEWISSTKPNE